VLEAVIHGGPRFVAGHKTENPTLCAVNWR